MSWAGVFGKFRTVAPKFAGYATSTLVAVAAKKGYDLSAVQAAAIVALGGDVLSTVIGAVTRMNPNGANAPSMVRTEPLADLEVPPSPYIEAAAENAQRMREAFAEGEAERMPVIPLPTPAPNAATSRFIEGYECPFCTGENGAHHPWCKLVGGDGVAPPGFLNDTRRVNHAHMRKLMADVESGRAGPAVMEAFKQATATPEPPAQRSRYLKPKVSEAEKVKDVVKVRRKPRKAR